MYIVTCNAIYKLCSSTCFKYRYTHVPATLWPSIFTPKKLNTIYSGCVQSTTIGRQNLQCTTSKFFFLSLVCQRYQCLLTKFTIGRHFWRWTRVLLEMVTFLILGPQKIARYCIGIEGNRTFSSHFSPLKYCCTWEFYIPVYRALLSKETNTVQIRPWQSSPLNSIAIF